MIKNIGPGLLAPIRGPEGKHQGTRSALQTGPKSLGAPWGDQALTDGFCRRQTFIISRYTTNNYSIDELSI